MSAGTLYDIADEFRMVYEMGTDPDCDEQTFADTVEALTGELEIKGVGYVNVMKQLEMEAKQADEVSKMFADKAEVRKNHIKRMKEALKYAMETIETDKINAGAYTIKLQNNGGVAPLVIDGEVPQNMTKVIVEPDNQKIREFLKDNECEWAHIAERGKHVVIK